MTAPTREEIKAHAADYTKSGMDRRAKALLKVRHEHREVVLAEVRYLEVMSEEDVTMVCNKKTDAWEVKPAKFNWCLTLDRVNKLVRAGKLEELRSPLARRKAGL